MQVTDWLKHHLATRYLIPPVTAEKRKVISDAAVRRSLLRQRQLMQVTECLKTLVIRGAVEKVGLGTWQIKKKPAPNTGNNR